MGFVDKLRGELLDIVEWIDDGRHTLVWRFPRYHNQIKHGARLIVRPGQVAILVSGGKIADVFDPGTYSLETSNLPVLSTLQGWKHGFDSPFKAEVYFVTTRQITELKWGTPSPVLVNDPDLGPIRIRAFGTFTLKAQSPEALLNELVGTDSSFDSDEIMVLLRGIVANCFAELMGTCGLTVTEFAASYGELSEKLRVAITEKVDDEYGLDLPQLWIVNISLPEEVEKAFDARSSMGIIGDLSRYQQYQTGAAMPVAAENPAGGVAGAGIGLGIGMAAMNAGGAGPFGGGSPNDATSGGGPTPPPVPGAAGPVLWHVVESGAASGPYDVGVLRAAAGAGTLTRETLVWSPGMGEWCRAGDVDALRGLFLTPPPPPTGS